MTVPADDPRAALVPSAAFAAARGDGAAPAPTRDPARETARDAAHDGTHEAVRDGQGRDGQARQAPARELAPHEVLVRHALEVSRLTVTRMAEELGIPRATLEAYRLGTRRMPAAARLRLSAYLTQHAEILRLIAQALGTAE